MAGSGGGTVPQGTRYHRVLVGGARNPRIPWSQPGEWLAGFPSRATGDGGLACSGRQHNSSGQGASEKEGGGLGKKFLIWIGY